MSISRRLLAIIGKRLPAIYDVIPRGPQYRFEQGRQLEVAHPPSRFRRSSWVPRLAPSSSTPSGSPIVSVSMPGRPSKISTIGVPPDRKN